MNLAEQYAKTLYQASIEKDAKEFDSFFANFVALLKDKSHYKILPAILKKVEQLEKNAQSADKTVLIVREAKLAETYKKELEKHGEVFAGEVEVREDPHVVGGFIAKTKTNMIDQSYRSKLLDMYRKLVA